MRNSHPETRSALVLQLNAALLRGYWRLAIRRFLVLQAYDFDVPEALQHEVAMLMARCPAAELRHIRLQVGAWRKLHSMRPHDTGLRTIGDC